ncbi:hypothetical protein D9613_006551 [Agrocybe pediades]|uniref:Uncharacterized protein n=1 Tax=Agrocybe pediades TaxID=84607 RepID=A0A8H4QGS0_9AGAR|nr:hypothetical protein D9613_006551 [Agrocybe pediades]
MDGAEETMDRAEETMDKLEESMDKAEESTNELKKRVDKVEDSTNKLRKKTDELWKKTDELKKDTGELRKRVDKLEEAIDELKKDSDGPMMGRATSDELKNLFNNPGSEEESQAVPREVLEDSQLLPLAKKSFDQLVLSLSSPFFFFFFQRQDIVSVILAVNSLCVALCRQIPVDRRSKKAEAPPSPSVRVTQATTTGALRRRRHAGSIVKRMNEEKKVVEGLNNRVGVGVLEKENAELKDRADKSDERVEELEKETVELKQQVGDLYRKTDERNNAHSLLLGKRFGGNPRSERIAADTDGDR